MKIINKKKFIKRIKYYKYIPYIKYETELEDKELEELINILNTKGRLNRIRKIINEGLNYIDHYYRNVDLCLFKNNRCICHRTIKKNYINGCCRKCKYQSNFGCKTRNVACKMFNCSYVKKNQEKLLTFNEIPFFKLFNPYQRFILKNDYFTKEEEIVKDLYVGPIYLSIRLIKRFLIDRVIK